MGYAGNEQPQFVIPTTIATNPKKGAARQPTDDFDYFIGEAAIAASQHHVLGYPIRHGQIDNWDLMEAYWAQCFFSHLRCDPEEHALLLTEPPLNAPENREFTAEIMFESFNVPALYIGVQAVLALAASWLDGRSTTRTDNPLTGVVVDSGDGVTHLIPVVDGYAIGSAIKHIPLAGREITHFVQQSLRERPDLTLTPEDTMEVARRVKEECCYVCPDLAKEFLRHDLDPAKYLRNFQWKDPKTGRNIDISVGQERFLAPEIFFKPEMVGSSLGFTTPLPNLIDGVVQACPIDTRRGLYKNIVLSGGSTMFRDFDKRLQRDIKAIVDERLAYTINLDAVNRSTDSMSGNMAVNVLSHRNQRYAVWAGGSLFASMPQFPTYCHTKADYDEHGPSICRQSRVFGSLLV